MKIAQITPYMHPAAGGPPVVVHRLAEQLSQRGHEVRVLTSDLYADGDPHWSDRFDARYGLEVHPTRWPRKYGFSREFSRAITDAVRQADIVQIHTLWTYASFAAARACLSAGVPFLVMPHGMLDPHSVARGRWKKQAYGRLLEWPLLCRANGMCYTHPEEERLARHILPALPQGHIVELGVEEPPATDRHTLRAEFLRQRPELRNRRCVLFLGRLHSKKGLDLLIPAFQHVAASMPDAQLLLVGPGERDYVAGLRRQITELGLEACTSLTGPLYGREKWGAMAASDLFVLPSYQENFALAAVDALRSGLPVLLSRRVNLCEDLADAGAGRVCELTIESVATTIAQCLADAEWRAAAVAAGDALLQRRFNWSRSAATLAEVYESILRG